MGIDELIKLAVISAVVLFIVILLISLLIPSTVLVSRAIGLSVAKDTVWPTLADLLANLKKLPEKQP